MLAINSHFLSMNLWVWQPGSSPYANKSLSVEYSSRWNIQGHFLSVLAIFFFKPENDVRGSVKSMPTCLDILLFHLWIKHLSKATSRLLSITVERIRLSEHDHKHQRKKSQNNHTVNNLKGILQVIFFVIVF